MLTQLAHRIELDPTHVQANYFARACGVARFTWNWALAKWNELYAAGKKPSAKKLKKLFNEIKATEFPWILETHKDANQQVFAHLGAAFKRFFKKLGDYPVFKRWGQHDSCYVSNDKFEVDGENVRLPIIGWIRMHEALRFDGKIMSGTISREAGRWFLSVQVKTPVIRVATGDKTVGVDLGISALATLSTGEVIEGPKPLGKALQELRRLNKSLARKVKGSSNWHKAAQKLARLYARIAAIRNDFLHKLTTRLCRENATVVIEDLCMAFMLKNGYLSRAASDMGLGEFKRMMKYKAPMFGTLLIIADRFFASTKTCSNCGSKRDVPLSERTYRCENPQCGLVLPRDHNAAINLEHLSHGYPRLAGLPQTCGQDGAGLPITGERIHAWTNQELTEHTEDAL
jgi:putative transposase